MQTLAEGLKNTGYEPVVVSTSSRDYTDAINGVKVYYISHKNLYWIMQAKEKSFYKKPFWHTIDIYNIFIRNTLRDIVYKEKPGIIYTNNLSGFSTIVWKIAKEYNIKVVHTLRDHYLLCIRSTMFKNGMNCREQCLLCKIYSLPKKKLSEYVDVVVGTSNYILKRHLNAGFFPNAEKKVIYNPIATKKLIGRKKHEGTTIIGYIGNLAPHKGVEYLLKNFSSIDDGNVILNLYGRGITREYARQLKTTYQSKRIRFMGFRPAEEIYNKIDIAIVPSLVNEAFGRVVVEANTYGIPVLASARGALPELIKEGENGYIFDPEKTSEFIHKLYKTIELYKKGTFTFNPGPFQIKNVIKQYLNAFGL